MLKPQIEFLEGLASRCRTSDQAQPVVLSVLDPLVGAVAVHGDSNQEPEGGDDGTDRQNHDLSTGKDEGIGSVVKLVKFLVDSGESC